jgi:hypothetical protein
MTVFLCILVLCSFCCDLRAKGDAWAVLTAQALHVLLTLGLAALALVSYLS